MSEQGTAHRFSNLLAGRWQIPLALVAAAVASVSLYQMLPAAPDVDFDAVMADLAVLEEAGDTLGAADSVANLLEHQPPLPDDELAVLHDRLSELIYRAEADAEAHDPDNLRRLIDSSRQAAALGKPPTPRGQLRVARARLWLGEEDAALASLRDVLNLSLSPTDRRIAVRDLADLLERRPEAKLERRQLLEDLLSDAQLAADQAWWALHSAVEDALDEADTVRARALLEKYGDRLKTSDLKGYGDYLEALVLVAEGRPQEAEPLVQWIDTWLSEAPRTSAALDHFGHLPSLNRWLMGHIHLTEDRPQDALEAFEAALAGEPESDIRIAASVGRGMALGALDRHAAARAAMEEALETIEKQPGAYWRAVRAFQKALLELYEEQYERDEFAAALGYLELAARLTPTSDPERRLALYEQLGEAAREAARTTSDPQAQRRFSLLAGRSFEQAADLVDMNDDRLATLLWSAAEHYDEAGRLGPLRRMLERFVPGRNGHPNMPMALLLLGQAYEGFGDLPTALSWYERLIATYPRLEEAVRARVLSAKVLLSLGPERFAEAERILMDLLTSGHVDPSAAAYREALLCLCDLLYDQERYAEAIGRLEDFCTLYPDDDEQYRARFMKANAYRRSAFQLRDEAPKGASVEAARSEARARLQAAATLYGDLLEDLRQVPEPTGELEMYTRLALFYRGDCLFELNEPEALQLALATYRNAAARFEGNPMALTAHVQIANIHLRQGELTEAARALERARWLLRTVPDQAYARSGSGTREDWRRFLDTVLTSDLFREVFAAAP